MRYIIFVFCLSLIGCNTDTKEPHKTKSKTKPETKVDSTQIHPMPENASVDLVTGRFNFHKRDDFVAVDDHYANKEVYLQKKTYQAFKAMADSAQKDGVQLIIVSGTRNFWYQKSIWDRKWNRSEASTDLGKAKEILLYSSMPMTSRHHWGTDLDFNNLNNDWFEEGEGKKVYDWLNTHANYFGFYQPYTDKSLHNRAGYEEEKWHWSYMPLAGPYLNFYNNHVTNKDIRGFEGSGLAPQIDMVGNYVNGVSIKVKNYN